MTPIDHPFPHVVEDGLWPEPLIEKALYEAVTLHGGVGGGWDRYVNGDEAKWALPWERVPGACTALSDMLARLQHPAWIAAIERAFGIDGLEFDGLGGGIHLIEPGGFLGVHVDFNRSADGRYRRVNCLTYLQGEAHAGGDLELWSRQDGTGLRVAIPPTPGRTAMFATSENSWHGHPLPYWPTSGLPRVSVAAYYFTRTAPDHVAAPHSTVFVPRSPA